MIFSIWCFFQKNEQTNSTLLLCDLFSFVFWKNLKTPKRHFEINWPLEKFFCIVDKATFHVEICVIFTVQVIYFQKIHKVLALNILLKWIHTTNFTSCHSTFWQSPVEMTAVQKFKNNKLCLGLLRQPIETLHYIQNWQKVECHIFVFWKPVVPFTLFVLGKSLVVMKTVRNFN